MIFLIFIVILVFIDFDTSVFRYSVISEFRYSVIPLFRYFDVSI